jgi:hypothetical protein
VNAQAVDGPSSSAHGSGAGGTSGEQAHPGYTTPENGRVGDIGEGQTDSTGHHGAGNGWDVRGDEDEHQRVAHHVEARLKPPHSRMGIHRAAMPMPTPMMR